MWMLIYFLFFIKGNKELQLSVLWAGVWKDLAAIVSAVLRAPPQQGKKMQLLLTVVEPQKIRPSPRSLIIEFVFSRGFTLTLPRTMPKTEENRIKYIPYCSEHKTMDFFSKIHMKKKGSSYIQGLLYFNNTPTTIGRVQNECAKKYDVSEWLVASQMADYTLCTHPCRVWILYVYFVIKHWSLVTPSLAAMWLKLLQLSLWSVQHFR